MNDLAAAAVPFARAASLLEELAGVRLTVEVPGSRAHLGLCDLQVPMPVLN
jgi:hypothetical protein